MIFFHTNTDAHSLRWSGVKWYMAMFLAFVAMLAYPISLVKAQSLTQAMVMAYESNPEIKSARDNLRATDEGVVQALGLKRPTLSLEATGTYNRSDYSNQIRSVSNRNDDFAINLSQKLYDGGARDAALKAAEANILASRASLLSVEQAVMLDVAVAYMDVVRDQAVLDLRIKNVERLVRQFEAAEDRFSVGEVTRTDVAQAQSRLAQAQAQRISADGQLEISRAAFERVVGIMPETLPTDLEGLVVSDLGFELPNSRQQVIELALKNNPDIIALIEAEKAAKAGIDRQRASLNPDISLNGRAYETNNGAGRGVDVNGYRASLSLTIPLFQGGVAASQVRSSKALAAKALQDLDSTRRAIQELATQAWEAHKLYQATIEANEEVLRANRLALEGVEQEALVGSRTILDVLDAEQDVMDIEVELVRAKRERNIAGYQIALAIGAFTPQALALPVSFYDVDSNYDKVKSLPLGLDKDYLFPKPLISD